MAIVACCNQGSFVAHISNVSARESWSLTRQEVHIYSIVEFQWSEVYHKHLLAFVQIGQIHMNLSIEASCTQQCRVEHIRTVGGSQRNNSAVGTKSVHLREQRIERILT